MLSCVAWFDGASSRLGHPGHLHDLPTPAACHQRRPRRWLQPHVARRARDDRRHAPLSQRARLRARPRRLRLAAATPVFPPRHSDHLVTPPADSQRRPRGLLQHRGAEWALDHLRERFGPGRRSGGSVPPGDDRGDGLTAGAARHRRHAGRDEQLGGALGARRDEIAAVVLRARLGRAGAAVLREVRLTNPA